MNSKLQGCAIYFLYGIRHSNQKTTKDEREAFINECDENRNEI